MVARNEKGFFLCLLCKRSFSALPGLRKHLPIHTRHIQHACDRCGFVYGKKELLLDHLKTHSREKSSQIQEVNHNIQINNNNNTSNGSVGIGGPKAGWCPICNQGFTRMYNLKVMNNIDKNLVFYVKSVTD